MVVPSQIIILLTGIPASGKSEFAKHLVNKYGFVQYDLERFPEGWPESQRQEEKKLWDRSRPAFVSQVRDKYRRVVLDWGFPAHCLPWVQELQFSGVNLVWFDADIRRARENYLGRKKGDLVCFDSQVAAIKQAGFPNKLRDCIVVESLPASGEFLSRSAIESRIFQVTRFIHSPRKKRG